MSLLNILVMNSIYAFLNPRLALSLLTTTISHLKYLPVSHSNYVASISLRATHKQNARSHMLTYNSPSSQNNPYYPWRLWKTVRLSPLYCARRVLNPITTSRIETPRSRDSAALPRMASPALTFSYHPSSRGDTLRCHELKTAFEFE